MELRQELGELIEAYAAAKCTANQRLVELAGAQLVGWLEGVEITRKEAAPDSTGG